MITASPCVPSYGTSACYMRKCVLLGHCPANVRLYQPVYLSSASCAFELTSSACTSDSCCAERDESSDRRFDSLCSFCASTRICCCFGQRHVLTVIVRGGSRATTRSSFTRSGVLLCFQSSAPLTTSSTFSSLHLCTCCCVLRSIASESAGTHIATCTSILTVWLDVCSCSRKCSQACESHTGLPLVPPTMFQLCCLVLRSLQPVLLAPQVKLQLPLLLLILFVCKSQPAQQYIISSCNARSSACRLHSFV